ncbi:MAG TPA: hypothetical protein P5279_08290 [Anaerohalosphaeraceae bacterium]|nr:hypothetical protein [Anaerohalosphaeraceae bacterium]HRT50475.1 hypothetical protein [Anaerohalosphaeraceae bacterium]HRT86405.1 hypothetical protein [Anaerohalosphaeraceae bacterium]
MAKWRIEINMNGMGRWESTISADGLSEAKRCALRQIRERAPLTKHLYLEARKNGMYTVVSHLTDIGEAKLVCLDTAT